jgi:uncharacterized coiled-coil protein SlyX
MCSTTELVLKLRIVQLEGRLALYESLISDLSNMASIQKVAGDIKLKLQDITRAWEHNQIGHNHIGQSHGG